MLFQHNILAAQDLYVNPTGTVWTERFAEQRLNPQGASEIRMGVVNKRAVNWLLGTVGKKMGTKTNAFSGNPSHVCRSSVLKM